MAWSPTRWATLLDRIEHRQSDVGLRFWGPPLWLQVTMTGPDSDLWPTIDSRPVAWDWQSNAPCHELARLDAAGATDHELLDVVGRYTIENLILNAVHEIGEWLRFDGRRIFPAHLPGAAATTEQQGNGEVVVHFTFGPAPSSPPVSAQRVDPGIADRVSETAAAARFTYLPDATITYEDAGPVIRRWHDGHASDTGRSRWSAATIHAARSGRSDATALIARDVHQAVVSYEADRICRAFHIDGTQPWSTTAGAGLPATLSIDLTYGLRSEALQRFRSPARIAS